MSEISFPGAKSICQQVLTPSEGSSGESSPYLFQLLELLPYIPWLMAPTSICKA